MSDPVLAMALLCVPNWTDVSVHEVLRSFCAVGIVAGLVFGLVLGLVARREDGWGGYGSFPRRATRLAHVAAVMLPALAGLYSLLLPATGVVHGPLARWGAGLWIVGAIALPAALVAAAWWPARKAVVVPPALVLVAGAALLAAAILGGGT